MTLKRALKVVTCSPKRSVHFQRTIWRYISEDSILFIPIFFTVSLNPSGRMLGVVSRMLNDRFLPHPFQLVTLHKRKLCSTWRKSKHTFARSIVYILRVLIILCAWAQSVQQLATGWTAEGSEWKIFFLFTSSRPVLGPMDTGAFFPEDKVARAWSLTSRLQPVPRSRIRGSIHPLPHTSSWHSV
jgi:hypothetical protein